jgi:hypothetical protein
MRNSNSKGCLGGILWIICTIIFLVVFFVSLNFLRPVAERIAEETVCQSGTIVNESIGNKTTCIDKKTGQKIDVSVMQIFGFCPSLLVFVAFLIINIVRGLIIRKSKASASNRSNFTNL